MKILIVVLSDKAGGAEKILRYCANYFQSKGYGCEIVIFGNKSSDFWNDFNTYYLGSLNLSAVFKLIRFIRNKKYFLASSSLILANSLLGLLRILGFLKCKNLIIRESTQVFKRFNLIKLIPIYFLYFPYLTSDKIIFQTEEMMLDVIRYCPFLKRKKYVVKHNPLDTSVIDKLVNKNSYINYPYIFAAGRLVNVKGFDLLIKAYNMSNTKLTHKLIISGDGPEMKNLITQANKLQLSENVIFVGFQNNVYPLIKNTDLCVISSRIEGFPNILNEMIYLNDKVLSSHCTAAVSKIDFILNSDINNIEKFAQDIDIAISTNLNSSKRQSKINYISRLDINDYFDDWI